MSCSCNNSYYNLPCCCPTEPLITTTTTQCLNGEPCEEAYSSDCIIYNGDELNCLGITTGMNMTQIIQVILNQIPECTTTTTEPVTTTTAPPVPAAICLGYSDVSQAAACDADCSTYYVTSSCYTAITTPNPFVALDCSIYVDAGLTIQAPVGFYAYNHVLSLIIGSGPGEITGVTNCP